MTGVAEIQISEGALRHNLAALRGLCPAGMRVAAVVKADAYGHGLGVVVRALAGMVDCYQVDDLSELKELRKWTDARALVLGYVPPADVREAIALRGELAIYDEERFDAICQAVSASRRATVHIEVDALLGRLGVLPGDVDKLVSALKRYPNIEVASAYAHYANIEDTNDPAHAMRQEAVFEDAFRRIKSAFPNAGRHMSATSGLLARESAASANDLVRMGIGLYGLYPSVPFAGSHGSLGLQPVMRWVSTLAQVKTLPAGHPVSYGLQYVTTRPTRIGVVPQGYSDGFDRGLSNRGEVLVGGRRRAVIGRVAMNMFMVDLSDGEARQGDEVVLLGRQGDDAVKAEEMAEAAGTINYEVVARVSPLLVRRAVE